MQNRFVRLLVVWILVLAGSIQAEDIIQSIAPPSVIFEVLALDHDIGTKVKPKYRSPIALVPSPDGRKIYIAEQTAKRIAVYNLETKSLEKPVLLPNEVTGLTISADGTTLFATCSSEQWPDGMVCVIGVTSGGGGIVCSISEGIGSYPCSPVLSPDELRLYVCNRFSNSISVVMLSGCTVSNVMKAGREPFTAALTPDGKRLIVGNYLPADRADDSICVASTVTIFDTDRNSIIDTIKFPDGSHSLSDIAVSPDGKYAFVTNTVTRHRFFGDYAINGGISDLGVIDLSANSLISNVCLDFKDRGMANPWEVHYAADGFPPDSAFLLISHSGNSTISAIPVKPFMQKVQNAVTSKTNLQMDNTALTGFRTIINTGLDGCRSFTAIGRRLFAAGYFDDNRPVMEEYPFCTNYTELIVQDAVLHSIGTPVQQTAGRLGELLFHSSKYSYGQGQSCHTCHPSARMNGMNWSMRSFYYSNIPSLVNSWWTPPTEWTAESKNTHESIKVSVYRALKALVNDTLCLPLDTFCMYLKPFPSPYREKGRLSPSAQRGKMLYYNKDKVDCINCHKGPLFFDDSLYDVGVHDQYTSYINTPSLVESWRTAPYGHIGSYTDIREIMELTEHSDIRRHRR